jgi:hypothetical protein
MTVLGREQWVTLRQNAQFSLKRSPDEGLTPDQLARARAWETALISIIKQEMLHLALSTNILTAIGAAPHFERPNFPILSRCTRPGPDRIGAVRRAGSAPLPLRADRAGYRARDRQRHDMGARATRPFAGLRAEEDAAEDCYRDAMDSVHKKHSPGKRSGSDSWSRRVHPTQTSALSRCG